MPLSADRATKRRGNDFNDWTPASGAVIYRGAIVALNASSQLVPGAVSTTLRCVGVAQNSTADQAYGGRIRARHGTFQFRNSAAGDAITAADISSNCFIVDDETVAKTNGSNTRSVCGVVRDVDAQGVWVEI